MRPGELFRHSAVRTVLLGLVLPATVVLSGCGVGLPLWSLVTLALIRGHFGAAGLDAKRPSMLAGFLLAGLLVALGMSAALGASIAEHARAYEWAPLGSIAGPAVLLALLSPLALIVPALLDPRCTSATHALRAALDGWSRVSRARRLLLWACPWSALLPIAFLMLADARPSTWLWLAGIPVAIAGPMTSLYLVSSWVSVRESTDDVEDAGHVPRGTVVLAAVTVVVSLAVGGALVVALLTPVPMARHEFHPPRHIDASMVAEWRTEPQRIEGTSLEVRLADEGVMIEAEDGGGVGRIEPPYGGGQSFRVRPLDDDAYRVVLRDYGTYWYVDVDRNGVRLDDGLGARFSHHVGLFGLGLIMLLGLGWLGSVIAGVRLAHAQTLSEIKSSTDHRSADRRRVLEGTLRLSEGAKVEIRNRQLVVHGSATIEGSGLRVRIPDHRVRVRGAGELRAGSAIALVGTFEKLTSEGHRDANAPWPDKAFVVPGGRGRAVAEEIRRASNLAVAAMAPTLLVGLGFLLYLGLESF